MKYSLKKIKDMELRLTCPEVDFGADGLEVNHPLDRDIMITNDNKDGMIHVSWGCGVTKYKTLSNAHKAISATIKAEWNRIHQLKRQTRRKI